MAPNEYTLPANAHNTNRNTALSATRFGDATRSGVMRAVENARNMPRSRAVMKDFHDALQRLSSVGSIGCLRLSGVATPPSPSEAVSSLTSRCNAKTNAYRPDMVSRLLNTGRLIVATHLRL